MWDGLALEERKPVARVVATEEVADGTVLFVELLCARCLDPLDDDGFCSACGAVTIAGKLRDVDE